MWNRITSPVKNTSSSWNALSPRVGEGALGSVLGKGKSHRDGGYPKITGHVLNSRENNINP